MRGYKENNEGNGNMSYSNCMARSIEHALSARREYMTKEGEIIYRGRDHYARLAATKHLRDFMSAGRPAPKQPEKEDRKRLTLPELEALLKADAEGKKQALQNTAAGR